MPADAPDREYRSGSDKRTLRDALGSFATGVTVATCVDELESLYAVRPDAVRRAIVSTGSSGASAFADAFKLRKD